MRKDFKVNETSDVSFYISLISHTLILRSLDTSDSGFMHFETTRVSKKKKQTTKYQCALRIESFHIMNIVCY